jgi:excinuclease ABC subunit A
MIDALIFYARQSPITDPGPYGHLFDVLPDDLSALAGVVQGLLIPSGHLDAYGLAPEEILDSGFGIRRVADLLAQLQAMDEAPLHIPREAAGRLGAICRNFAVLLVSMLRYKGIPARLRVGFAGYFPGPMYWDHRIAECWNAADRRWMRVDPMLDEVLRDGFGLAFDPADMPLDEPFLPAGDVWHMCRAADADPFDFGDSPDDRGMPPIRYALLHDFDALNKVELLGSDAWGELIDKREEDLTDQDIAFLDRVATLVATPDDDFDDLRAAYQDSAYGEAVRAELAALGLAE